MALIFASIRAWLPHVAVGLLLCLALPAQAARFHVKPGGVQHSGPSTADRWNPANCYPTLALAAQAASPADTLLLSRDDHEVTGLVTLARLLANRDLDTDPTGCRLLLGPGASLVIDGLASPAEVRGIEVGPAPTGTELPAVQVLAPAAGTSTVLLDGCVFAGLRGAASPSSGGAAVNAVGGVARVALTLSGTRFVDCSAGGSGGAVYAGDGVDLVVQSCEFLRSEARFAGATVLGGAIAALAGTNGTTLTLLDCTIVDSVSWGPGGAVYAQDTPLVMRDTEVRGSRSAFGGVTSWSAGAGVFLRRAGDDPEPIHLVAERCAFVDNRGDLSLGIGGGDGGGMMIRGSDTLSPVIASIVDCRFERNFNHQGAGLYIGRAVNATIERSYFLENTAYENGGGAFKGGGLAGNIGETAHFSYCVFAGNRAGWDQNDQPIAFGGFGGAFMVRLNPRAELHNCTFVDNLSGPNGRRGDAIFLWNEGLAITDERQRSRLVNCLFYGANGYGEQVRSEFMALSEIVHSAWEPGQMIAVITPTPGSITFDGSPFAMSDDWRLEPGSVCIDAGFAAMPYLTDIVGTPVPTGSAPDIGAFEYVAPTATTPLDAAVRLHPVRPNPANPRTEIAFGLDRAGQVHLSIHDLAGRKVVDLLDAPLSAGEHRVVWNGRDGRDREAASGLYLVRLNAAGSSVHRKITLVR